jgi:hypothetical protein
MALVVILGVGMNLVPILATRKARIGTLFLSDLAHIMAFLSDDWAGRCLEWIQIQSNPVVTFSKGRRKEIFEPRYPKSREDVQALSVLCLSRCNLTGEFTLVRHLPFFSLVCLDFFLYRANSARNRQIDEFAAASFRNKQADRSIYSQCYPMIVRVYRFVVQDRVNQFTISLFLLLCFDFV